MDRRQLLAGMAALGLGAGAARAEAVKPIPVILHTDIGYDVDDTFALLLLLRRPELDLKLIVCDGINRTYRARLTAKLLKLAGRTDIPIALNGAEGDVPAPQSDWVGDFTLQGYEGRIIEDGVQAMIDAVVASPEPVTIISVGPAMAVAEAVTRAPEMARKARFVGMFGSLRLGYKGVAPPDIEYNVKTDPLALRKALAAEWLDCAITPLDSCGLLTLDGAHWQALWHSRDPFAVALIDNSKVWLPKVDWMPKDFDLTLKSSVQFDAVAVIMAFDERDLVFETLPIWVEDDGMTVVDATKGSPVRVATGWRDMEGFKTDMVAALTRLG